MWGFDRSPIGKYCKKSISPDNKYYATLCDSTYERFSEQPFNIADFAFVARLYDNKTGKILAITTFDSPVPDLFWGRDYVQFQKGGEDGDGSYFNLPPSLMDRILANRPRLVPLNQTQFKSH